MPNNEESKVNNQININEQKKLESETDDKASFYVRSMIKIFDPENGKVIVEKTN